jgi:HPr kinase/phosphorylase
MQHLNRWVRALLWACRFNPMAALPSRDIIHASCISAHGKGLLILGPSGAGKSALALQMIALGATLIADDRCEIWAASGTLHARAPSAIAGLIEARGIGILRLPYGAQTQVVAAIDLAPPQPVRLPPKNSLTFAGISIDFLQYYPALHFPSALMCYLVGTRSE